MKLASLLAAALVATAPMALATAPIAAAQDTLEVSLPYEEFRLDNGLRVIVHEDRKAPIVAVQVMYAVGSKDEPAGKTGFAHLFEHLMFNGSENFDKDFFVALKDMGATQYNGTTNVDRTNYYQTVPKGSLEKILFLESDRMGHLLGAVTQQKLDNQIGVVKNEKRLGEDRPFGRRIWETIYKNLYPLGHPYNHQTIGSMEDLDNATLDDVRNWFKQYYGAANSVLVLAGDVDAAEARPLVEKYFGHIPSGPPLIKAQANSDPLTTNKFGVYYDRVAQPRIYRAYIAPPTGSEDAPLLDVMARALGQGKTSRLYKRLVDERQIANSASVFYSEDILSGQLFFIVDVKAEENIDEVNAIIDEEILKFVEEGPTESEVERTKTISLAGTVRGLEAVAGKAATLAQGAIFVDDPDFFVAENLERLQAATPETVRQAAARVLTTGYYELKVLPFPNYRSTSPQYDRSAGLPDSGVPGDVSFPSYSSATLSNGIEVVVAPRPTVPVVEVALQFDAGTATGNIPVSSRGEPVQGLAIMVTSLMDEGTETRDAQEIALRAEEIGAQISVSNTQDSSRAYLSALKTELRPSLDLLADVVKNSTFPEEELEKFRKQAIDGLRQERASVNALGGRVLASEIYGTDHPYGDYATANEAIAVAKTITRADLMAWRDAWLRPDNVTIYVTGDTSVDAIVPELERAFGDWSMSGSAAVKNIPTQDNPRSARVIVVNKPDTQQSLILAGRLLPPTGQTNDTAFAAMNDSFGGNFLSRINMNLREDKGWSYGVRSGAGAGVGQRLFSLRAPVQGDRTGDSIAELVKEMKAVVSDRPATQAELDQTVAGVVGSRGGRFETARSVIFSMMSNAIYGRPLDYEVGTADRYRSLELSDIRAMARDVLKPEELTWVIVGDWSKIEDQVLEQNLGPVEVRELPSDTE